MKKRTRIQGPVFQGKHFQLKGIRHRVQPAALSALGDNTISVLLVFAETAAKYGNPVWVSNKRLREWAGGTESRKQEDGTMKAVPLMTEKMLETALTRLYKADLITFVETRWHGERRVSYRQLNVPVVRNGGDFSVTWPTGKPLPVMAHGGVREGSGRPFVTIKRGCHNNQAGVQLIIKWGCN